MPTTERNIIVALQPFVTRALASVAHGEYIAVIYNSKTEGEAKSGANY